MKTITTLAAAIVATFTAAPALAQDAPAVRSVAVSYADLDLGSEAGREAFDNRLRQAVRDVCGTASSADLRGQNRVDSCRDELTARAAQQRDVALAGRQSGIVIGVRR
jgi:UrcA family protein